MVGFFVVGFVSFFWELQKMVGFLVVSLFSHNMPQMGTKLGELERHGLRAMMLEMKS